MLPRKTTRSANASRWCCCMARPAIAAAMGVSLSTVNRAHMAYDHGGIAALKPKPNGGRKHENMTVAVEKALPTRRIDALDRNDLVGVR